MFQVLKLLTFSVFLTSALFAAEKTKSKKTKEMLQIEALYLKLNKSAEEKYVSKMEGTKELFGLLKAFREQQEKFEARALLLEKQSKARIAYLDKNKISHEGDENLKKINDEINYMTIIGNRRLEEAWNFFKKNSPDLSENLLNDFEKVRDVVTITASVAAMLFKNVEKVNANDQLALELILDIGKIPSSSVERPELRDFSFKALEAVKDFDLVLFLVSGAVVANEITALD